MGKGARVEGVTELLQRHLLACRIEEAGLLIEQAARTRSLPDLFVDVLETALYGAAVAIDDGLAGRELEIATFGIVQAAVKKLGGRGPWRAPQSRVALAVPVPGEEHTLGLEMLATLLGRDGWRTHVEVPGCSPGQIAELANLYRPDLVCLSMATPQRLEGLAALIRAIRSASPGTKVMLGGLAARLVPERVVRVGADLFAEDAREALATVRATFRHLAAIH